MEVFDIQKCKKCNEGTGTTRPARCKFAQKKRFNQIEFCWVNSAWGWWWCLACLSVPGLYEQRSVAQGLQSGLDGLRANSRDQFTEFWKKRKNLIFNAFYVFRPTNWFASLDPKPRSAFVLRNSDPACQYFFKWKIFFLIWIWNQ